MDYSTALPDSYLVPMFEKWQRGLDRDEVVSVFCAPHIGAEYRSENFLSWQKEVCGDSDTERIYLTEKHLSTFEDIKTIFNAITAKNVIFIVYPRNWTVV